MGQSEISEPTQVNENGQKPEKIIRVEPCVHKGEKRLQLLFGFDRELIDSVKKVTGCRWSATMGCWHVPDNALSLSKLKQLEGQGYGVEIKEDLSIAEPFFAEIKIIFNPEEGLIYIKMPYDEEKIIKLTSVQ